MNKHNTISHLHCHFPRHLLPRVPNYCNSIKTKLSTTVTPFPRFLFSLPLPGSVVQSKSSQILSLSHGFPSHSELSPICIHMTWPPLTSDLISYHSVLSSVPVSSASCSLNIQACSHLRAFELTITSVCNSSLKLATQHDYFPHFFISSLKCHTLLLKTPRNSVWNIINVQKI